MQMALMTGIRMPYDQQQAIMLPFSTRVRTSRSNAACCVMMLQCPEVNSDNLHRTQVFSAASLLSNACYEAGGCSFLIMQHSSMKTPSSTLVLLTQPADAHCRHAW